MAARITVSKDGRQSIVTEYAYDALDRLTDRSEGGQLVQHMEYDRYPTAFHPAHALQAHVTSPTGQLTVSQVFDPNQRNDYEERVGYDLRGSIVNRTVQIQARSFEENFGYTLDGAQTAIVTPRGLREDMLLNRANRLKSVSVSGSSFGIIAQPVIEQITYNAKNQVSAMSIAKGRRRRSTTIRRRSS